MVDVTASVMLAGSSCTLCVFAACVPSVTLCAMPALRDRSPDKDLLLQEENELAAERTTLMAARRALQKRVKRKTEFLRDVGFVLFVWACPSTTMCQAYLDREQQTATEEAIVDIDGIERRYLNTTVEVINAVLDRCGGVGKKALQTAERFRRDFELARWIETENAKKGIAPTSNAVCEHMAKSMQAAESSEEGSCMRKKCPSTKWVQRFRARWNFKRSSFQPREHLAADLLREKVIN